MPQKRKVSCFDAAMSPTAQPEPLRGEHKRVRDPEHKRVCDPEHKRVCDP